jgi:hypothetical protein
MNTVYHTREGYFSRDENWEEKHSMRIPVQYCDGEFDFVEPGRLDELIRSRMIIGFRRSDGWVRVPHGPLRMKNGKKYRGAERRGRER